MDKNVPANLRGQAHGNVDLRTDKSQDKGGLDPVTLPAAPDFDGFPNLMPQP